MKEIFYYIRKKLGNLSYISHFSELLFFHRRACKCHNILSCFDDICWQSKITNLAVIIQNISINQTITRNIKILLIWRVNWHHKPWKISTLFQFPLSCTFLPYRWRIRYSIDCLIRIPRKTDTYSIMQLIIRVRKNWFSFNILKSRIKSILFYEKPIS